MKTFRAGPLTVRAAGGADRDGGGGGPAVVLCHGYGAPGDDLVALQRAVDAGPEVRWFFPEAPLAVPGAGRAWWPIDMAEIERAMLRGEVRMLADTTPAGLPEASAALSECLRSLEATHGVLPATTVLGGFSQGSMLTTELTLTSDATYAGLAVLSGTLLAKARWEPLARERGAKLHVLQSHGRRDPILPFGAAEALRALLEGAGASVTWVPFPGQHEIPYATLEALGGFLRARLAG